MAFGDYIAMGALLFGQLVPHLVNAAPMNITIEVPEGTTTQKGLICYPSTWSSILAFYVGNYIAHAATVRSDPGAPVSAVVTRILLSLFYPAGAALQGVVRLTELAILGKTPLEKAARSGALCTVYRTTNWEAVPGQYLMPAATLEKERPRGISAKETSETEETPDEYSYHYRHRAPVEVPDGLEHSGLAIHGSYKLPPGYAIREVKPREKVLALAEGGEEQLTFSFSFPKALVAIIQLVLSISTLVKAKGNQIDRYGCAAFGLTVAPYAIASFTNLLSGIVTPEYPCLYLVRSASMREAESIPGCFFDGVVGRLGSFEPRAREDLTNTPQADTSGYENDLQIAEQATQRPRQNLGDSEEPTLTTNPDVDQTQQTAEGASEKSKRTPYTKQRSHMSYTLNRSFSTNKAIFWVIAGPLLLTGPFIIVGALSGFRRAHSSKFQILWTMGWLAAGQGLGLYAWGFSDKVKSFKSFKSGMKFDVSSLRRDGYFPVFKIIDQMLLPVMMVYASFAVGGFVVVGKMLVEYGDCKTIG